MSAAQRAERKATGAHYTPPALAAFVAGRLVRTWVGEGRPSVLDPAVGDGALLAAVVTSLQESGTRPSLVAGLDTDTEAVRNAADLLSREVSSEIIDVQAGDFLDAVVGLDLTEPGLFDRTSSGLGLKASQFDLVIANPPYVRTQVLGKDVSQRLASSFGLRGRVDLAYPFLLGIASALKPGGVAAVIVSNRFMTTRAGGSVRSKLKQLFDILHVWDLGDTQLFDAAVLPAVLLLRAKGGDTAAITPRFTSIYRGSGGSETRLTVNPLDALSQEGPIRTPDGVIYQVRQGRLSQGEEPSGVWRLCSDAVERWLGTVRTHTESVFSDIGKVRVGVKTTADRVFIRADWHVMPEADRPELLRPLITHHSARRYRATPSDYHILYTHETVDGRRRAIDIGRYPKAARYLAEHRAVLEGRQYVANAGRQWFEIWVPQDPVLWNAPKLVFRDIAVSPTFWLDTTGAVVNGDCYWIASPGQEVDDRMWLALAVANSSFIEVFYDRSFNNKLYAGRRRFMTQYVEQFPIPSPRSKHAMEVVTLAKQMWHDGPDSESEQRVDSLVWQCFGCSGEEAIGQRDLQLHVEDSAPEAGEPHKKPLSSDHN